MTPDYLNSLNQMMAMMGLLPSPKELPKPEMTAEQAGAEVFADYLAERGFYDAAEELRRLAR